MWMELEIPASFSSFKLSCRPAILSGNHFGQDLQHEQKLAWEHVDALRIVLREQEKVF